MVDNTVVINETGHCDDGVNVKNQITLQECFNPRNLLPADIASCTEVSGGVSAFGIKTGAVISSDTTQFIQGSRSLKVTTNGYNSDVTFTVQGLVAGQKYTFQAMMDIPLGITMSIVATNISYAPCVGIGDWKKYTYSFIATNTSQEIRIGSYNTTQTQTFWMDCLQLELGPNASAWMPGNLLTYNQQTVETDLTGLYSGGNNTTQTLTRETIDCYKGTSSAKLTLNSITTSYPYWGILTGWTPCDPNKVYLFSLATKYFKNNHNNVINGYLKLHFVDSQGKWVSGTSLGSFTQSTNWTQRVGKTKSPSNAAMIQACIFIDSGTQPQVGDALYWDEAWLIEYPIDSVQVQNKLAITEQPVESESLVVKPKVTVNETGLESDSVSLLAKIPVPEHGSVNEQVKLLVNDFVSDVMHSNDTVAIKTLTKLIDNCAGYEDLALKISMGLADSGKGTDTVWRVCEFMKCLLKMKYPKAILKMKYPKAILKMKYPR